MPGMYAIRSSSSSSSAAKPPFPSHQRHVAPASAAIHAPSALVPPPTSASRVVPANRPRTMIPVASAQPIRAAQVTDPPVETACTRHHGASALNYCSSGSPHDPSTVCLAAMVHEFLEEELALVSCGRARCNCVDGVCSNDESCIPDEPEEPQIPDEQLCEILEGITSCTSKPELLLLVDVAHATEAETEELTAGNDSAMADSLRRPVMKRLREAGHNAAICKSRWKHADGLPAGDYEYMDVLVDGKAGGSKKQERFIVDIDFKAQFEIARASKQYTQLLGVLPRLYVGRAERLKQILKIMSNAAKRSLKEQGLLLPPWRKHKYMQAKWFSSYRRTTNTESMQSPHRILGLGLRAPKLLSLDFTKEMDLLFYKAQLRGNQNKVKRDHHLPLNAPPPSDMQVNGGATPRVGFANSPSEVILVRRDVCTAVCTDWQLPALDDKCKGNRDRVSGISTAFKQASFLPKQPSRLAMVSVGS